MDKPFPPDAFDVEAWTNDSTDYEKNDVESMRCPWCGCHMVRRTSPGVCLSDPPMRKLEWWCKCGATRHIHFEGIPGSRREKPSWEAEWERANPEGELSHA